MLDFLDTANFKIMQKNLDILMQRINITGQNISNVNTPHYKAKKLEFEKLLQQKIEEMNKPERLHAVRMRNERIDPKQRLQDELSSIAPQVFTDETTEMKVDGNNVDIDHENLELAKIQIQYNYMVRKLTDEYNLLKIAVNEGR